MPESWPADAADTPEDRLARLSDLLRELEEGDPRRATLVMADQSAGWRSGRPLRAEVYLHLLSAANVFSEDGFDLIYSEWILRHERGELPDLADYQARFPAYAAALAEQVRLDEILADQAMDPPDSLEDCPSSAETPPRTEPEGSSTSRPDATEEAAGPAALPAALGRYRVLGEIARGGMGLVCRGHDPALDRELAIKVLLDQHLREPDMARRFLTEARICSRLQHPGVVPLHDLGTLPDGRPFFAMKLVQGDTLADLLARRADPGEDRARFLKVVEQVSLAVAYAHSKGIIHRDLKPANVMVGAFGEVLVMDWGLAKMLGTSDGEQKVSPPAADTGAVLSLHPEGAKRQTEAGTVLGTPAYMAPEQARGEIDRLDERADVFGLGAILCEVLTGQPPYFSRHGGAVILKAAGGELAEAFARLDGCGADPELVGLAKRCLAAERDDRPRTAEEVAKGLTDYLAGVEARLRRAELAATAAAVCLREQRKRWWLLATVAALVLVVLGGAGWFWQLKGRQAAKSAEIQEAVTAAEPEALRLAEEGRYLEAQAVVQRIEALLQGAAGGTDLPPRLARLRADLDMLNVLDNEVPKLQQWDFKQHRFILETAKASELFANLFRRYGVGVLALDPATAAERLRGRVIRQRLIVALDDWARYSSDADVRQRLFQVARAVDPDPQAFLNRWRDAVQKRDRYALIRLSQLPEFDAQPPVLLVSMVEDLKQTNALGASARENLLRRAWDRYPSDFGLNFNLALSLLGRPKQREEALRLWTVAQALRPRAVPTYFYQGVLLFERGELTASSRCFQKALELDPRSAYAHYGLGVVLSKRTNIDGAITNFRRAIAIDSTKAFFFLELGATLEKRKGDLDGAAACYHKVIAVDSDYTEAYSNLGCLLDRRGKLDEAIAAFRTAIDKADRRTDFLSDLAIAFSQIQLRDWRTLGDVIDLWRRAVRAAALMAVFHSNLSDALGTAGDNPGAIAAARKAIELNPSDTVSYLKLMLPLAATGHLAEARATCRRAERLLKLGDPNRKDIQTNRRELEQMIRVEAKLPAVLSGKVKPTNPEEQLALATVCLWQRRYTASARFYAGAFAAQPGLEQTDDRRDAALAAAQAGRDHGEDQPKPDAQEQARWRWQALQWLRDELDSQRKKLAIGRQTIRYDVQKVLRIWLRQTELAGIRDEAELRKLPEAERAAFRKFWADVAALLAVADPSER